MRRFLRLTTHENIKPQTKATGHKKALHKTSTITIIIIAATGLLLIMATASVLNIDLAPIDQTPTNSTGTTDTSTSGTINTGQLTTVNVEVYQDQACTQPLTFIDRGNITIGKSANKTIHVKNAGNVPSPST